MSPDQAKRYLDSIAPRGIQPGLDRMKKIMQRLNHPEREFESVHVTGTNGKGSTCSMLESVLRNAGYKTGLYTSPHLLDLTERISVSGHSVSWPKLARWIGRIRKVLGSMAPRVTYFEMLTAAAFSIFAEENVDLALVEVGLGGRFDATNVLPNPKISIITNVTLEHTEFLGETIRKIAWEKSHIIKPSGPCVTGASGSALSPIRAACIKNKVKLIHVKGMSESAFKKYKPSLQGRFQRFNLAIAVKCVQILRSQGFKISAGALKNGIRNTVWPGRFEKRNFHGAPAILDGAHNPGAVHELLNSLKLLPASKNFCTLVFNTLKDKDLGSMFSQIAKSLKLRRVLIPRLGSDRSLNPNSALQTISKTRPGLEAWTTNSVREAWNGLRNIQFEPKEWILATGSLYLVGESIKFFNSEVHS